MNAARVSEMGIILGRALLVASCVFVAFLAVCYGLALLIDHFRSRFSIWERMQYARPLAFAALLAIFAFGVTLLS